MCPVLHCGASEKLESRRLPNPRERNLAPTNMQVGLDEQHYFDVGCIVSGHRRVRSSAYSDEFTNDVTTGTMGYHLGWQCTCECIVIACIYVSMSVVTSLCVRLHRSVDES